MRSSAWVALGFGSGQLIAFASMLVLVRLLDPRAFGVVALAATVIAVLAHIQESGLASALVHTREDPLVAASSVLVFAAASGLTMAILTFALAPAYTDLLRTPAATPYVQALAVVLVLRGLAVVPAALLERELNFRARTKSELSGSAVQAVMAIGLAFAGFGAWSLVIGQIAAHLVQLTILWGLAPFRPSPFGATFATIRQLVRYGRHVGAANVLDVVSSQAPFAIVGRMLGVTSLGVFSLAWRLAEIPATVIGVIVGRVMFPVYSHLQTDLAAVRAAYVQNLQRTLLLALPVCGFLALAAEPIILGLFGERWIAAADPMRILAVYSIVRILVAPSGELLKGIGKPQLILIGAVVYLVVAVAGLVVFVPSYALIGASLALLGAILCAGVFSLVLTFRSLALDVKVFGRALIRPVACAVPSTVAVAMLVDVTQTMSAGVSLCIVAAGGGLVYVVSVALFAMHLVLPVWRSLKRVSA